MNTTNKLLIGTGVSIAVLYGIYWYRTKRNQSSSAGSNFKTQKGYTPHDISAASDPRLQPSWFDANEKGYTPHDISVASDPRLQPSWFNANEKGDVVQKVDFSMIKNNRKNRSNEQLNQLAGDLIEIYSSNGISLGYSDELLKAMQEYLNLEQTMTSLEAWKAIFRKLGTTTMTDQTTKYITGHYGLNGVPAGYILN